MKRTFGIVIILSTLFITALSGATKFPAHRSWYLKLRVYSPNPRA